MNKSRSGFREGQALVEYALVLIWFMVVLFGMIEGGRLLLAWHQASGCARQGARQACLYYKKAPTGVTPTDAASVVDAVALHANLGSASGQFTMGLDINGTTYNYNSQSGWSPAPPLPVATAGLPVRLKVTLPFNKIWGGFPFLPNQVSAYEIRYSEGPANR